jgi:hypothetical protein
MYGDHDDYETPERFICPRCGGTLNPSRHGAGIPPCDAGFNYRAARARGLVSGSSLDEEIRAPIRSAGFGEWVADIWRGRGIGPGSLHQSEWFPVWAVQAVSEALETGDDPESAVRAYYSAVGSLPPDQVADSMLMDQRLIGGGE